ncbi:MAG: response regulator [Planctomycetota bacterium]|nr:response regulator [Planctomycetota bacterium]MDA1143063.1 response regulator [Planctomycetota bacterium]
METPRNSILVVDDDSTIRLGFRSLLEQYGFEVETAEDGREGLKSTMRREFDLILLDIYMPHMNGLDCIKALRISRPFVPVIIITATPESKLAQEALREGADDLLPKPVPAKILVEKIKAVLSSQTGNSGSGHG